MKYSMYSVLLLFFFLSCKKEADEITEVDKPEGQKHEVIFNLPDFAQRIVVLSKGNATSDQLKNSVANLTYIVYDSGGTEVSRIEQDSTGATTRFVNDRVHPERYAGIQTFGCIRDSLVTGDYTVIMIASTARFEINTQTITSEGYYFNPLDEASFYYERGLDSWSRTGDTFFKKFSIKVGTGPLQQDISLDRIVGKAEINILDSKPGTTFKFLFTNEHEAYKFSDETAFGTTNDIENERYLEEVPGGLKLSFSKFLINTQTPIDVTVKVYENGALTATKTIKGVRFYKNKRTILTGRIYPPTTIGFSVTVNDEFDAEPVEVSF
ncbi:hypothetical protein GZH53_08180 [Flavihumibacter sp. R14]|nr:hypothetical protein [Flavihumibacter soli]